MWKETNRVIRENQEVFQIFLYNDGYFKRRKEHWKNT